MSDATAFSPDYVAARARFRGGAHALGCALEEHAVGVDGPDGSPLTIDVARMGSAEPERAVVVSSGLHGVEGFFGSAVQCALLEDHLGGWSPPDGVALVLIHALNPYGFAYLRRVDQENIDLNRNFLRDGEAYAGSPAQYGDLDGLLNPTRPPGWASLFFPKAIATLARHGMPALKNAVAGGQYDFPKGVFFGGSGPSATQRILRDHLPRWVGTSKRVFHVDFHTGLGARATYKLLVDHAWDSPEVQGLGQLFGADVVEPWEPKGGVSYEIRGGLGTWCKALLPRTAYDVLAAEFGTVHILQVIASLHHENRAHHWGDPADPIVRGAKERLRDVFAPPDKAWRDAVVPKGVRIVQQALDAIC